MTLEKVLQHLDTVNDLIDIALMSMTSSKKETLSLLYDKKFHYETILEKLKE